MLHTAVPQKTALRRLEIASCFSMLDFNDRFDPTLFHELSGTESEEKHLGIRMVMSLAKEVQYYSTFKSNNLVVYLN